MTSLWIRSSRRGSFLGFAMALQRTAAGAEEVAGCGRSATIPLRPGLGSPAKALPRPHHLFPAPTEPKTSSPPGGRDIRESHRVQGVALAGRGWRRERTGRRGTKFSLLRPDPWPKTLCESGLLEARFPAIFESLLSTAETDCIRPRGIPRQLGGMPL